jgi:hypothetical protein
MGNLLLGEAQQRAPYDKGQLRGSGDARLIKNGESVRISFNTEYAAIQHEGGDIYPVDAKALSVPIHPSAKGKSPRDFDDLIYIKRNGKAPLLVRKIGKGKIQPMYILVKKVHITGKKYLSGAVEDNHDRILREFARGFRGN